MTVENTLHLVIGTISIERAAEVTGRSLGYLRALSNPYTRERLAFDDAIKLDLEWRAQQQEGYPLLETYERILKSEAQLRFASAEAIGRLACIVAKEAGEATAALVAASMPGASRETWKVALRELEEAGQANAPAIALLRELIDPPTDAPLEPPP
ncbi:hypothetical protein [Sphingomonas sp. GC_Shp_4]|nr:hypothetical protein [Sphingomonas sp. GC_Shp_4]